MTGGHHMNEQGAPASSRQATKMLALHFQRSYPHATTQ